MLSVSHSMGLTVTGLEHPGLHASLSCASTPDRPRSLTSVFINLNYVFLGVHHFLELGIGNWVTDRFGTGHDMLYMPIPSPVYYLSCWSGSVFGSGSILALTSVIRSTFRAAHMRATKDAVVGGWGQLNKFLLSNPRVLPDLATMEFMFLAHWRSSLKITLRYLILGLLDMFQDNPIHGIKLSCLDWPLDREMILHLVGLNFIPQVIDHLSRAWRSFWSSIWSSMESMSL